MSKTEQAIDFSKPVKVTREYAKELTWTGEDYEITFDPEFLEVQLAIAEGEKEKDHLAQVIVRQLKRETELASEYFANAERIRAELEKIADIVGPYFPRV